MDNKEIRRTALARLNFYWIESAFLYVILYCGASILEVSALIYIILNHPELGLNSDTKIIEFIKAVSEHKEIIPEFAVFAVICFITVTPMYFGIKWCFFQAAQWRAAPVSGAFYAYYSPAKWLKTLAVNLRLFICKMVYSIPAVSVCFAAYMLSNALKDGKGELVNFFVSLGTAVIFIGTVMVYMSVSVKYDLVIYVYAKQPDSSISAIFSAGVSAAEKARWRFGSLKIWFLPLLLISTAGFPSIVIIPIYWMVKAIGAVQILNGNISDDMYDNDVSGEQAVPEEMAVKT